VADFARRVRREAACRDVRPGDWARFFGFLWGQQDRLAAGTPPVSCGDSL